MKIKSKNGVLFVELAGGELVRCAAGAKRSEVELAVLGVSEEGEKIRTALSVANLLDWRSKPRVEVIADRFVQIRLKPSESDELRRRAAEAGQTLSDYIRSKCLKGFHDGKRHEG